MQHLRDELAYLRILACDWQHDFVTRQRALIGLQWLDLRQLIITTIQNKALL